MTGALSTLVPLSRGDPVLSIGLVASPQAATAYFFRDGAGCGADYYLHDGEQRGRWAGAGAESLGLKGSFGPSSEIEFRRLLEGRDPRGGKLVAPVLRSDPRALLPAGRLVTAVRSAAARAGLPVRMLLDDRTLADRFARLAARARSRTGARGVRVDLAARIARAAGLDLHRIYATRGSDQSRLVLRAMRFVGRKVDVRRAGYDLTFSAPKSVSVLAALAPEPVAAQLRAAHAAAVDDTLAWLERSTAYAVRGHQGDDIRAERIPTHGFVAAAFDHGTSRAGDPQLHTHVVIANLIQGVDGRWSAVDSRALYRRGKTAGYLYQAALRTHVSRALGLGWGPVHRGSAELVGMPAAVLRAFSKRAVQMKAAMQARGTSGAKAAQAACLDTRPDKDRAMSRTELLERWATEVRTTGHEPDDLVAACLVAVEEPQVHDRIAMSWKLLEVEGLTRHGSTFDRDDLLQAIAAETPAEFGDVDGVESLATHMLGRPQVVPVGPDSTDPWQARYTTLAMLSWEERALDLAARLAAAPGLDAPAHVVEWAIASRGLGADQADMVRALTRQEGALHVVIGPAGSGKTAALAAANDVWRVLGRPVHGVALSAMAARQVEAGAGIRSRTVAGLITSMERARQQDRSALQPGSILVVDEAGMVGTRDLHQLLAHAWRSGTTLVLVGDPAQLPEIEAGGLFSALARTASAQLEGNRRQEQAWERDALTALRAGRVGTALDAYLEHDRVHIAATLDAMVDRIVSDYLHAMRHGGEVAILAATRAQVRMLNAAVRQSLTSSTALRGPELTVSTAEGELALRAGDRVMVTRNDYDAGLLNGTRAVVNEVDLGDGSATITTTDGLSTTVSTDWLADGRLNHAYAVTCHKAQGQTLDTTLVAGSAALTSETGYVALSRGRSENHLYLAPDPGAGDLAQEWLSETVLADVAQRLGTIRRQRLASEQLRPAENDAARHDRTQREHRSYGISR